MLVWLDESLETALGTVSTPIGAGFSAIFQVVYRGEHLVLGSRTLLQKLANDPGIAAHERHLARSLAAKLSQIALLEKGFNQRISVVHDNGPALQRTANGWRIQLVEVGKRGIKPTVLLGEDISDVQLYVEAARHYIISQGSQQVLAPRADLRGAGGKGNVWRTFAVTATKTHDWCLCVTDSDKLTPLCKSSPLTRHIDSVETNHQHSSIGQHYVLPVREIENIIPLAFVDSSLENTEAEQNWNILVQQRATPLSILHHADLKFGTSLSSIRKLDIKSPQRAIWDAEISRLSNISTVSGQCNKKICPKEQSKTATCSCFVTPAITEKLAEKVYDHIEKQGPHQSYKQIASDPNKNAWLHLGQQIFEWTCGHSMKFT